MQRFFLLAILIIVAGCARNSLTGQGQDQELVQAALKAAAVQTQRTMLDLRTELQELQKELGISRIAQAYLEGELREAQRRLADTHRLLGTQREELARTREDRERLTQASRDFQGQLVELNHLRQQVATAVVGDQRRLQEMEAALERQAKEIAELKKPPQPKSPNRSKGKSDKPGGQGPALQSFSGKSERLAPSVVRVSPSGGLLPEGLMRAMIVQRGDTLWGLARQHGATVGSLKVLNELLSDVIVPGQELVFPDRPTR